MKSLNVIVKFTKIGNRIKCELPAAMYCTIQKEIISKGFTLSVEDFLLKDWFGTRKVKSLFKKRRVIYKKVDLHIFDSCDTPHAPQ
jgi:hypothetical protein